MFVLSVWTETDGAHELCNNNKYKLYILFKINYLVSNMRFLHYTKYYNNYLQIQSNTYQKISKVTNKNCT